LRVIPARRQFTKVAPGHFEATSLGSAPAGAFGSAVASVKGVLLGQPLANSHAIHERLTKTKALGVFSSDPLSSAAYGPEEILIVLAIAGAGALVWSLPIAAAIIALLWAVRLSYLQTIKEYPSGGGAYIVAHDNLGQKPALVAAGALLVDYVLTVSVSVAAGIAAITSAVPSLLDYAVPLSLLAVAILTWGNLRGVRESGAIFMLPTYFFLAAFGLMIAVGLFKVTVGDTPGSLLHAAPAESPLVAAQGLTLFLVLKAFASGCTSLTGVEAISNGIPAFKPPESKNARTVMQWEALLLAVMVLGVAFLSTRYGLVPGPDETIVSKLGRQVLGENVLYYGYQAATTGVLLLAANTAYQDFPRLSAILARDNYMPRQFIFRGDRLAFTNGILALAGLAAILLVIFQAKVTSLIPLYVVGVFISITLSQTGMVRHWWRRRGKGWRGSILVNGTGAIATLIVTAIVASIKFFDGAWLSLSLMAICIVIFYLIWRHYSWFKQRITVDERDLPLSYAPRAVAIEPGGPSEHVIVPVDDINKISLGAISLARELSAVVTAVHLSDDREAAEQFRVRWNRAVPDVPLLIVESPYRAFVAPMVALVQRLRETEPRKRISLILPTFATRHCWERLLHNRDVTRLKGALRDRSGVSVLSFTYDLALQKPTF
jgi:amino acid transporter